MTSPRSFLATALASTLLPTLCCALLLLPQSALPQKQSDDKRAQARDWQQLKKKLQGLNPPLPVASIVPSPIDGIVRVNLYDGQPLYATEDGSHLLAGKLFEVGKRDLIDRYVVEQLAKVDPKDAILFAPVGRTRHTLTVFTDVDCGYCRKFHLQVDELNQKGVAVRYLAFPRNGLGSETHRQMSSAWCAAKSGEMLTRLKTGKAIPQKSCEYDPIQSQYDLGKRVGLRGTPAIYLENGRQIGGYREVGAILQELSAAQ